MRCQLHFRGVNDRQLGNNAAAAAAEAVGDWRTVLAGQLARSGADDDDARSLATMIIAAIEGAVIMALATQSTDTLDDVGRHLIEVIKLHLSAGR